MWLSGFRSHLRACRSCDSQWDIFEFLGEQIVTSWGQISEELMVVSSECCTLWPLA